MNNKERSGGIGFFGALTIAFIVLRLCGIISWPWLWVLAPIWLPILLAFMIGAIAAVVSVITTFINR